MMRISLLGFGLLVLANCAPVAEEAVLAEPVVVESPVAAKSVEATTCGEDDGIGGTGCSVD